MEETLDYNSMPRDFAHCLNAGCERAEECLRHRMALLMPAERGTVTIVNPRAVDPSGRDCAYFKPGQAVTYALGITRLLDDLPHAKSVVIKQQLIRHFGRTLYYRFRRKERAISPEDQKCIRQIFLRNGVREEPVFDSFVERLE